MLFKLLQSGDRESFSEALIPVRGRIVQIAQKRLQREDVEDVVQQTLLTLWEKRSSVRDADHLLPYLFQILRNKLGDTYRLMNKERILRDRHSGHMDFFHNRQMTDPEEILNEKEWERIICEAIEICAVENAMWGKILQLVKDGRSREEIREELGNIPMATVYTRVYRARQKLMKILRDEFGWEV